jgi:hypothetical protein
MCQNIKKFLSALFKSGTKQRWLPCDPRFRYGGWDTPIRKAQPRDADKENRDRHRAGQRGMRMRRGCVHYERDDRG